MTENGKYSINESDKWHNWYFYAFMYRGYRCMLAVNIGVTCTRDWIPMSPGIVLIRPGHKTLEGHTCAYIELSQKEYDKGFVMSEDVHWGFTYGECADDKEYAYHRTKFPDGTDAKAGHVVVGWDYDHCNDHIVNIMGTIQDIKDAIDTGYDREESADEEEYGDE